ncbi:YciI family protein [Phreatobacter stygius]|uniref:YciI family protein n=1 Tax=Phreatobacter stygius TaxID=1940610 RepID=A0A4D7BB37_9HYPH|nr:YciI family protein [Phreatobacter stygius]QCI65322.1 YciI family protein [Phreatobacter stygius]
MLFTIHALDKPGALPTRLAHYDAHKAFLADTADHGVRIVMSGPLVEDDGVTAKGSFFLVEAADRATVETFNRADPFHAAGIWSAVTIVAFLRRQG